MPFTAYNSRGMPSKKERKKLMISKYSAADQLECTLRCYYLHPRPSQSHCLPPPRRFAPYHETAKPAGASSVVNRLWLALGLHLGGLVERDEKSVALHMTVVGQTVLMEGLTQRLVVRTVHSRRWDKLLVLTLVSGQEILATHAEQVVAVAMVEPAERNLNLCYCLYSYSLVALLLLPVLVTPHLLTSVASLAVLR